MNWEQDLQIDKNALDEEWIKQPYLYMQYAEKFVYAQDKKQKAKENLEVVKAQADKRARENLTIKGEKITESKVSSEIVLDPEYKKALSELNEILLEVNLLDFSVKAMDHRKKALEKSVDLYLGGYFSKPRETKNNADFIDDTKNKVQQKQKDILKKYIKI